MKIFISWSGTKAQAIALELKSWLPQINLGFEVFVSTASIKVGKPWFDEIRQGLINSDFGIGIFTKENLGSTWMFFEHGAIASQKDFAPLLCGCELTDLMDTPATLFQAKVFERNQFLELVFDLNERCEQKHSPEQFKKLFSKLWPSLNKKIYSILSDTKTIQKKVKNESTLYPGETCLLPYDPKSNSTVGIEIISPYAELELQKIFRDASKRVDCLVLSGRNLFSPSLFETLRDRIQDKSQTCKIRILAMDVHSEGHFFEHRKEMMGSDPFKYNYNRDLDVARDHARNLAILDPEHKKFDVRFYNFMPTQFYYIVDDFLYLTFILSIPVSRCPVLKINLSINNKIGDTFSAHFEHYWRSSRYFVSIVALNDKGKFLMVKNRKRNWEWPGGFIEPNEDPKLSAIREFREESGYDISDVYEVRRDANGTFYAGRLGKKLSDISVREMESVDFFDALPKKNNLSFPNERENFIEILEEARLKLT